MNVLLLATRNAHKVREIQAILGSGVRCRSLAEFVGVPELVEDAETFEGNAARKARQVLDWVVAVPGLGAVGGDEVGVLADDSGLEVDYLGGAPGVKSARFAAEGSGVAGNAADGANTAKLLRLLEGVGAEGRAARFRCVLALARPGLGVEYFRGVCEGRIREAPAGIGGFGYDPVFVPAGYEVTFAELGEAEKNRISHRARALEALRCWLGSAA